MKPDDVVGRVPMFVVNTDRNIALQDGYFLMRQQYLSPEVRALIEAGEKAGEPVIGLDRDRLLEWAEENLDDFDYAQLAGEMAVGKFDLPATPVEPQGQGKEKG